jgi:predicted kinase
MQSKLVIFSGLPGTGKSTLADRLARELRWPLLCIDDVIGEVPENAGVPFWDSKVTILLDLIETQLKLGLSVIADSVFMNMDRNHAQELARKYNARFLPIHVFVSDESVWKERVTNRFDELKDKDVASWERIQHQRERFRNGSVRRCSLTAHPFDRATKGHDFVFTEMQPSPMTIFTLQGRYH